MHITTFTDSDKKTLKEVMWRNGTLCFGWFGLPGHAEPETPMKQLRHWRRQEGSQPGAPVLHGSSKVLLQKSQENRFLAASPLKDPSAHQTLMGRVQTKLYTELVTFNTPSIKLTEAFYSGWQHCWVKRRKESDCTERSGSNHSAVDPHGTHSTSDDDLVLQCRGNGRVGIRSLLVSSMIWTS